MNQNVENMDKNYYIVSYNDEYLDIAMWAGPLPKQEAQAKLKEILIKRLKNLFGYSDEQADTAYADAINDEIPESDRLHVYNGGASIQYASDYEEHFQIVRYCHLEIGGKSNMENSKVELKIGNMEFKAEGSADYVSSWLDRVITVFKLNTEATDTQINEASESKKDSRIPSWAIGR